MENTFKTENSQEYAVSKSFLSEGVSAAANDAAYRLLQSDATTIYMEAANAHFSVSKEKLPLTMWTFEFEGKKFYLAPKA